MIAIYLAPLYLLVCAYILFRSIHWIQVLHAVFQNVWVCRGIGLVYLFVVFSILIAFMAPDSGFRRFMKLLSNYWLGVLVYAIMTLGIADGVRLIIKYPLEEYQFSGKRDSFQQCGNCGHWYGMCGDYFSNKHLWSNQCRKYTDHEVRDFH